MPGQKISTLTPVSDLQAADQFPLARSGSTYKITGDKFASKAQLDSLSATATGSFALKTDLNALSANPFIAADTSTIDLTLTNRTLSASVVDNSVTNSKLAFDGGSFAFRNKIINGNFDIWQRGTTFTGIGPGTFTADRWTTSATTGTLNKNISRQTLSDLDLPATEAGLEYFLRGSYTSGTNIREWAICNPIELTTTGAASPFKVGKTYTLSYYARCASPNNIAIGIHYRDASNSATNEVIVGGVPSQAITTSWTRYTYTFAMVSPNATNTSLCIIFASHTTPANTNIDITGVQLEEGLVATPFENRPVGTELALCQRYYMRYAGLRIVGYNATSEAVGHYLAFPVTMRSTPTVQQLAGGSSINVTSLVFINTATTGVGIYIVVASTGNAQVSDAAFQTSAEL